MVQVSTASHSDYGSNCGTLGPTFWGFTGSDPTAADAPGFTFPSYPYDGAISCLAGTKIAQITDGTTNTYLLGEKYLNPDHYLDSTNRPTTIRSTSATTGTSLVGAPPARNKTPRAWTTIIVSAALMSADS